MKWTPAHLGIVWAGSLAAAFYAGHHASDPGAGREPVSAAPSAIDGRNAAARDSAHAERPDGRRSRPGKAVAADDVQSLLDSRPQSTQEKDAYREKIAALLSAPATAGERMTVVARILSAMTPENAWLIKDGFGQSWDEGCHFQAEHDLMWARLGETLRATAADELIKSDGPFWPVHGKFLEGWARSDPQGVLTWLSQLQDHGQRLPVIGSAIRGLAAATPDESLRFVLSLPEGEQTAALIAAEAGAGNLGGTAGAERLRHSMAALPPEEFRQVFAIASKDNPVQAVTWADAFARLHPEKGRDAYDAIADSWGNADVRALSEWLDKVQNHSGSDAMTLRMIRQIAREDPEAARAWTGRITDPALRTEAESLLP